MQIGRDLHGQTAVVEDDLGDSDDDQPGKYAPFIQAEPCIKAQELTTAIGQHAGQLEAEDDNS